MKKDKFKAFGEVGEDKRNHAILGPHQVDGSPAWHIPRKDVRTFPKRFPESYQSNNLKNLFQKKIIDGWEPKEKPFDENSNIFTMGSCFATNIQKAFVKRKAELGISNKGEDNLLHVPSSVNNSFGITQFFEWALENKIDSTSYWYDDNGKYTASSEREKYQEWLKSSDGFIFTFGVSEIWKDLETDTVFWRAVPQDLYNENKVRYKFELSTVEQNINNMKRLIETIHKNVGNVPIILTVSPVPLLATFRGVSAVSANSVSKAILRVAVDQIMSLNLDNVYYWPSYEVFKDIAPHIKDSSFQSDVTNHPHNYIVKDVVNLFFDNYFKS